MTPIKPQNGATGIDVYAQHRNAGNTTAPEFAGDQLVEVRSYVYKQDQGDTEVRGANCSLSAAEYSATMTTPARVRVPLYRGQSSTLAVSCEMPGYKKSMITVAPMDITRNSRYANGASAGLLGVVAVAAIDAMSDNSKNDWRYPIAKIVLEPETPKRISTTE
ncbi:MAG: hypothetical protein KDJ47_12540 [Hyphomicrobiaceae bacterium]|nr:hypothetical protein [Hyphomicrobiaceae bacterium]